MNRREFLKGGIVGVFGAVGFWLTRKVLKAEEPEPGTVQVCYNGDGQWYSVEGLRHDVSAFVVLNPPVPYRWFFAKDDASVIAKVLIDGHDIGEWTAFYGPEVAGVSGWGYVIVHRPAAMGCGVLVTERLDGDIEWTARADATMPIEWHSAVSFEWGQHAYDQQP